jgi:curved DNA-binding protein
MVTQLIERNLGSIKLSKKQIIYRMNYYNILGVTPSSTKEEIKKRYRLLAKKNHPDVGGDVDTFRSIQEAYENLYGDDKNTQTYNQDARQYTHSNLSNDVPYNISFKDAYFGLKTKIRVGGHLIDIDIPPRFIGGSVVYPAMGHVRNGMVGDLILHIKIMYDNDIILVDMVDLEVLIDIDYFDFIKRCQIPIKIYDKEVCKITIPANIKTRDRIRIPKMGMKSRITRIEGDLYVKFNIINFPNYNNMSEEQQKLIDDLEKESNA